jgi:DNA-binding NarL/FixJ family response regulator
MSVERLPAVGRSGRLRVAIIAPDTAYRSAVEHLLKESSSFKTLRALAPPLEESDLRLLEHSPPRLVLLHGSAAAESETAKLRDTLPSVPLVVLEGPYTADDLVAFLERGVSGFLSLSMTAKHIEVLLSALALGHVVVPRELLLSAIRRGGIPTPSAQGRAASPFDRLTPQEKRIL